MGMSGLTTSRNIPHEEGLLEARPFQGQRHKPLSSNHLGSRLQGELA